MHKHLFILILSCTPFALPAQASNDELQALYEMLKDDHADLLRGNFARCDFTGRIRWQGVSVHEEMGGYVVLAHRVEVLERYKGDEAHEITYVHRVERPADLSDLSARLIGQTAIVSLVRDGQSGSYEMGDNGYDLPDTPYLLSIARELAKEVGGERPQ